MTNLEDVKWNYDPKLGEFLSRRGVESLLKAQRKEIIEDMRSWLSPNKLDSEKGKAVREFLDDFIAHLKNKLN